MNYDLDCVEIFSEGGSDQPGGWLHSPDCPGFCEWACGGVAISQPLAELLHDLRGAEDAAAAKDAEIAALTAERDRLAEAARALVQAGDFDLPAEKMQWGPIVRAWTALRDLLAAKETP